jgi:hypothetical protein
LKQFYALKVVSHPSLRIFYLTKMLAFPRETLPLVVPGVDDDVILDIVVVQIDAAVPHLAF